MVSTRLSLVACTICALGLSACGNAEAPKVAAPPAEHGVFISSTDCADTGKLTIEQCGEAIDKAVAAHTKQQPIHKTLRQCQAAEGPDRCDRIGENEYRVRVQAFFVTMSNPPTAVALYPPNKSAAGFRSPSQQILSAVDEGLNMSQAALTVANENAKLPARGAASAAGTAAADIR